MRVRLGLIALILLFLWGCGEKETYRQLKVADQLLKEQLNDSAYEVLDHIDIEGVDDERCKVYYSLLRTQAEYRLYKPLTTTDMLDRSIAYFEKHKDADKLIRCYYYKGSISEDLDNNAEAITYLKQAEELLSQGDGDNPYELYVTEAIAQVNAQAKHYPLAVTYGRKAIKDAINQKDTIALAYDYMNLAAFYYEMGREDSSAYFLHKMQPLIRFIPEERRSAFYTNIGRHYEHINTDSAMAYYQRAITLTGSPYAYNHVAQLFSREGKQEQALQNWERALECSDQLLKVDVLERMLREYEKQQLYGEMYKVQSMLITLKDSISRRQTEEDIRGIQYRQDMAIRNTNQKKQFYQYAMWMMVVLLSAVIIIVCFWIRHLRQKAQLLENREVIRQLMETSKVQARKYELLSKQVIELKDQRNVSLATGKKLYDAMLAGSSTYGWSKSDFANFFAYYKLIDPDLMIHLEEDYDNLAPRLKFVEVLESMGYPTSRIESVMMIEPGTIRSYKSRINSKKKKK